MTRMQENLIATAMWVLLLLALGYFAGDAEAWEAQQINGRRFTCADVAEMVEAIEATPPEVLGENLEQWKHTLATQSDIGWLEVIRRAQLYIAAGYGSRGAWADCPVI